MPILAPNARRLLAVLLALPPLWGCSSTPEEPFPELGAYRPNAVQREDESIGKLLADIDRQVTAWSQLTLTAQSESDRKKARGIELNLARITKPRVAELIEQLETGPPINRVRAAAALGFSHDPLAQGPLLNALQDPLPAVVNNALISLGTLQRADTPLGEICTLARTDPDAQVRSNACRALVWIINAGGEGPCALEAARLGLGDPEPAVRAQSALLCGMLEDGASIAMLSDLLYDEHVFVARGAASSLSGIAARSKDDRGNAARALVSAFNQLEDPRREMVHEYLVRVYGSDLGPYIQPWLEWATNLP